MKINLIYKELIKGKIREKEVEELVKRILRNEGKKLGEINLILQKDKELIKINQDFLKHNYFTDVISFNYNKKDVIYGDIYISVDSVKRNAEKYNQEFIKEFKRVIIHGVLHLNGYVDNTKEERKIMEKKENFYLSEA